MCKLFGNSCAAKRLVETPRLQLYPVQMKTTSRVLKGVLPDYVLHFASVRGPITTLEYLLNGIDTACSPREEIESPLKRSTNSTT